MAPPLSPGEIRRRRAKYFSPDRAEDSTTQAQAAQQRQAQVVQARDKDSTAQPQAPQQAQVVEGQAEDTTAKPQPPQQAQVEGQAEDTTAQPQAPQQAQVEDTAQPQAQQAQVVQGDQQAQALGEHNQNHAVQLQTPKFRFTFEFDMPNGKSLNEATGMSGAEFFMPFLSGLTRRCSRGFAAELPEPPSEVVNHVEPPPKVVNHIKPPSEAVDHVPVAAEASNDEMEEEEETEDAIIDLTALEDDDFGCLRDATDEEESVDDPADDEAFQPRVPVPLMPPRSHPRRSLSLKDRGCCSTPPKASKRSLFDAGPSTSHAGAGPSTSHAGAGPSTSSSPALALRLSLQAASAQPLRNRLHAASFAAGSAAQAPFAAGSAAQAPFAAGSAAQAPFAAGSAAQAPFAAGAAAQAPFAAGSAAQAPFAAGSAAQAPFAAGAAGQAPFAAGAAGQAPLAAAVQAAPAPAPNQQLAICSICLDRPYQALLGCGHFFCLVCVIQLREAKKPCAICRGKFRKWKPVFG